MRRAVSLMLILTVVIYLVSSFIWNDLNIGTWNIAYRAWIAAVWSVFIGAIVLINIEMER